MPFIPTVRIKNGVAWRPGLDQPGVNELPDVQNMPLPQPRPRRKGDPPEPPPDEPTDEPNYLTRDDGRGGEGDLPPEIPPPPQPQPLWPKLSVKDQLAMALAAQMMPDDQASGHVVGDLFAKSPAVGFGSNLQKRLLLPQTEYSPADIFETWMRQSAQPDRNYYPEGDVGPQYGAKRRGI